MIRKVICLEEHVSDPDLLEATRPLLERYEPYLLDLGATVQDNPNSWPPNRPHLQAQDVARNKVGAAGEERLAEMDQHGITMQVLSYALPIELLPPEEAARVARKANERLAETIIANSTRFRGFAILPWQNPAAAVDELTYGIKHLGLSGALLAGHPSRDALLDDMRFDAVLGKLEELRVPLYIHPGPPFAEVQRAYYSGFSREVSARLSLHSWGWHHEAGIQIVRLILSGALQRHPGLILISGHWGEMVPFFLQRLDDTLPPEATGLEATISETYRKHVYVTPSGMLDLSQFRFVYETIGASRIMLSIDYPYLTLNGTRQWIESLPISEEERDQIAYRNAEALFRL